MVNPATHPSSRHPRKHVPATLSEAQHRTRLAPNDARAWRDLGRIHHQEKRPVQAEEALARSAELDEKNAETWALRGHTAVDLGSEALAESHFRRALSLDPNQLDALCGQSAIHFRRGDHDESRALAERVLNLDPGNLTGMHRKAMVMVATHKLDQALALTQDLARRDTNNRFIHLNNLANIKRDLGDLSGALDDYRKAGELAQDNPGPLSNQITLSHYLPECQPDDILALCKQWGKRYARRTAAARTTTERSPARRLKIGMISDGFRQHPVGAMITPAITHMPALGYELYFYSSFSGQDGVTRKLQAVATKWTHIATLDDESVAQMLRDDGIDILIDLSGHNAGTRMRVMAAEPAPVLIKWVGGLINTTGVESIDYLITDSIESPPGSDDMYTEKLIRMPDDYICYMPPAQIPEVGPLPAASNGHLTFGCFNNPSKINDTVLARWAELLHEHPGSQLLLKGSAFGVEQKRARIIKTMAAHGITADRLLMEGHSNHYALFDTYNRVDIALDPWPYSGGLTTCEALLMGVPVVTLPGPTFAGRHSATHLANAGLPELVVNDWEGYRARVRDLASNLDTLAQIRLHLRDIMLASPVCDGRRFAGHLAVALRAVWQRYCENKAPAALAFNAEAQPWFEDEEGPRAITITSEEPGSGFKFAFKGKISALDHGARLAANPAFAALAGLRVTSVAVLDPGSHLKSAAALQNDKLIQQYHSHVVLGDGQPGTLYACLDSSLSSTLPPLPNEDLPVCSDSAAAVLAQVPISTVRLDDVGGLERLDWLILDGAHDNCAILQNAPRTLRNTLLLQIRIPLADAYEGQTTLDEATHILRANGMRLLRLDSPAYLSYLPEDKVSSSTAPRSQQMASEAIFVPSQARLRTLDRDQSLRLAFLAHAFYGISDYAYHVLQTADADLAAAYLAQQFPSGQPVIAAPAPQVLPVPVGYTVPDAPHMEPEGVALLEGHLRRSKIFLEYGSGGSSVMATRLNVDRIYSVDSDEAFLHAVQTKVAGNEDSRYLPIYVNIGPTGDWGHPTSRDEEHRWPDYVRQPWSHLDAADDTPDLVLVDGRFRIASFLMSLKSAPAGCVILFDDYVDRPIYHVVERFLKPTRTAGRMAEFIVPAKRPAGLEAAIVKYCKDPS